MGSFPIEKALGGEPRLVFFTKTCLKSRPTSWSLQLRRIVYFCLGLLWLTACPGCPEVSMNGEPSDNSTDEPSGAGLPNLPQAYRVEVRIEGAGSVEQEVAGPILLLTAESLAGWRFIGWEGSVFSSRNPLTIVPGDETAIVARFVEIETPPTPDDDQAEAPDDDGDGVDDDSDQCDATAAEATVNEHGCSAEQRDTDGDGVSDAGDRCSFTEFAAKVDSQGCSADQRDADSDGIPDSMDQCAGTPGGTLVLATGCTLLQSDGDGDGVPNDRDRCPETVSGATIDAHGCPPAPPPVCGNRRIESGEQCDPPDGFFCGTNCRLLFNPFAFCGDGFVDAGEQCDPPNGTTCSTTCRTVVTAVCGNGAVEAGEECDPPNTAECNANCRYIPVCGNGRVETGEQCDSTNRTVCGCNCRTIVAGQSMCGNCVLEGGEECDPPGPECASNCLRFGGGGNDPVCGNGTAEIGEQCDPPNGTTCDDQCQLIVPRPGNDLCAQASPVGDGTQVFENINAGKDGADESLGDCATADFAADVWFCYTAEEDARVNVRLCGSSFDSIVAVYDGCACPAASPMACNDDGCAADPIRSDVTFSARAGRSYLVRVGGYRGAQGRGVLTLTRRPVHDSCTNPLPIGDGLTAFDNLDAAMDGQNEISGGCRSGRFDSDIWYCYEAPCSGTVTVDLCGTPFDTMLAVYPGCACPTTRALVCNDDNCSNSFGSRLQFTSIIHQRFLVRIGGFNGEQGGGSAQVSCVLGNPCGPGNGDCFSTHPNPGCEQFVCCTTVCAVAGSSTCCTDGWDSECVFLAGRLCRQ
jgi:hypothetical protein